MFLYGLFDLELQTIVSLVIISIARQHSLKDQAVGNSERNINYTRIEILVSSFAKIDQLVI